MGCIGSSRFLLSQIKNQMSISPSIDRPGSSMRASQPGRSLVFQMLNFDCKYTMPSSAFTFLIIFLLSSFATKIREAFCCNFIIHPSSWEKMDGPLFANLGNQSIIHLAINIFRRDSELELILTFI